MRISRRQPAALPARAGTALCSLMFSFPGGQGLRVRFTLRMDQLVEVALLPVRRFVLVKKLEVVLIEFPEELVPGNLVKLLVFSIPRPGKFETQNAWLSAFLG